MISLVKLVELFESEDDPRLGLLRVYDYGWENGFMRYDDNAKQD